MKREITEEERMLLTTEEIEVLERMSEWELRLYDLRAADRRARGSLEELERATRGALASIPNLIGSAFTPEDVRRIDSFHRAVQLMLAGFHEQYPKEPGPEPGREAGSG